MNELESVASGLLIYLIQQRRLNQNLYDSINAASKYVGLKAQLVIVNGAAMWSGEDRDIANDFLREIKGISRWSWESEIAQLKQILEDWKKALKSKRKVKASPA